MRVICQIPYIPKDVVFLSFEIHVSNQMNQKYKIWPALLVFHFLWVDTKCQPRAKSSPLSLVSHAGVKLLINSLENLLFDSLKTKLSSVLPLLMSFVS